MQTPAGWARWICEGGQGGWAQVDYYSICNACLGDGSVGLGYWSFWRALLCTEYSVAVELGHLDCIETEAIICWSVLFGPTKYWISSPDQDLNDRLAVVMWLHDQYRIQGYHYSSLRSMHSKDRFLIIFASLAPESTRLDLSFFILFLSSFLLFLFEFSAMCISIKHLSNCSSGLDSHTYQCTTDTDGDVSVRSSWYPQSFVLSIYKDGCPSTLTLNNLTLSSLSSANIILSYIVYSSSIFVHLQKWQTNAPVTPSPSSKPPTATSSPGDAQTAIPAPS